MAKKSMIQRDVKRKKLIAKYSKKRNSIKDAIVKASSLQEKLRLQHLLQDLPRDSAPIRLKNRCNVTGRPHGYYRDFGLSRHFT